jgi:hypothetical protein
LSLCPFVPWRRIQICPAQVERKDEKGKVTKAYLLSDPKHKELKFSQSDGKLVIQPPDKATGKLASVIRLDVSGVNP